MHTLRLSLKLAFHFSGQIHNKCRCKPIYACASLCVVRILVKVKRKCSLIIDQIYCTYAPIRLCFIFSIISINIPTFAIDSTVFRYQLSFFSSYLSLLPSWETAYFVSYSRTRKPKWHLDYEFHEINYLRTDDSGLLPCLT